MRNRDRKVVLDTETTGFNYNGGDRIIEVGCIELINDHPTGLCFQRYINPKRAISSGAISVHGITNEMLLDKPIFKEIAKDLIDFIDNSILVIHNAIFDCSFLNAEFSRIGNPKKINMDTVIDTMRIAREKYPGSKVSLDALCKRFGISLRRRDLHGALLDAELLANIYILMTAGEQVSCSYDEFRSESCDIKYERRRFLLSDKDEIAHREFIKSNIPNSLWR